jgi:sulfur carrier protein
VGGAAGVIVVTINGERRELDDGATIATAARAAGAPEGGHGVAVAVNGEVVPRGAWDQTWVRAGQEIEVLHAVQGG